MVSVGGIWCSRFLLLDYAWLLTVPVLLQGPVKRHATAELLISRCGQTRINWYHGPEDDRAVEGLHWRPAYWQAACME